MVYFDVAWNWEAGGVAIGGIYAYTVHVSVTQATSLCAL